MALFGIRGALLCAGVASIVAALVALALGVVGGLFMTRNMLRRVEAVNRTSEHIIHGDLAQRMLDISGDGLRRRASNDAAGMSEDGFLNPLRELVNRGYTRAEEMLKNYYGPWGRDLTPLFTEYNFL